MKTSYHGHTVHCKHGIGTTREHIEAAINFGLDEIAITEHVPIKGKTLSRIDYPDFDAFMKELNELKGEYSNRIKVLTGLECEYIPEIMNDHLELKEKYNIDYLVLGHHFSNLKQAGNHFFLVRNLEMATDYVDSAVDGIRSGQFAFIAHPDLFLNKLEMNDELEKLSRKLLEACQETNTPVEINGGGMRSGKGYPNRDFWTLAKEYDLTIIVNSDSHAPREIDDEGVTKAYDLAHDLKLEVTERLDFN